MTNQQLKAWLQKMDACREAIAWVGTRDLATAWAECPRGDWLLWLASRQVGHTGWPTRQAVVLAACACAERALVYVPAGDDRPRAAIETARAWARGEVRLAEVRTDDDAWVEPNLPRHGVGAPGAYAARIAAASAVYGYGAEWVATAAFAAEWDGTYERADAAKSRSLAQSAEIVRSLLVIPA